MNRAPVSTKPQTRVRAGWKIYVVSKDSGNKKLSQIQWNNQEGVSTEANGESRCGLLSRPASTVALPGRVSGLESMLRASHAFGADTLSRLQQVPAGRESKAHDLPF